MSRLISDNDLTINELQQQCLNNAVKKGFSNPSFSDMISLLHSEISEAYEEYRNNHEPTLIYSSDPVEGVDAMNVPVMTQKPEGIPIEFADLAIRLFHYCGYLGIDLTEAIKIKMRFNETRPYRHGNKKA